MKTNLLVALSTATLLFSCNDSISVMKKLTILLIIVLGLSVHASAVDFSDDRGFTVTALFGISQNHSSYNHYSDNHSGLVASPRIGYRFNSTWEAGALFRYENFGKYDHYIGAGIYGEWSFLRFASGLRLITEAHATFNAYSSDADAVSIFDFPTVYTTQNKDMTEIGFTPCIAYRIANSPVDLKLRYLFLGFNHSEREYKSEAPGCLGRGNWIIDASLRRLEIGASITF